MGETGSKPQSGINRHRYRYPTHRATEWFPAVEGALQAKTGLAMQRASCDLFEYRNIHAGLHRVWQVPEFIKTETTEVVGPVH